MARSCLSVILAAGEGTRMQSELPKVLHKIGGLPLVCHSIRAAEAAKCGDMALILGCGAEAIQEEIGKYSSKITVFEQNQRLGTAHAVLCAEKLLQKKYDDILIIFGDTPLIRPQILTEARKRLRLGADIVVSGFYAEDPSGYGRLAEKNGKLIKIIEEKDATPQEKKINLCNGGLMAVKGAHILSLLRAVGNHNAKGEYYLTDIIAAAAQRGLHMQVMEIAQEDIIGVNSRAELAAAEALWQRRKRREMMAAGISLQDPGTVYFSYDTRIAADVFIEPHVFFGLGVKIAEQAHIRAFSYIEGTYIGRNAVIGPYARLRPQSRLGKNVRIGNFCEIKQAEIADNVKINHLAYMGNVEIGAESNIGAGAVSCNYDGFNKEKITMGAEAFIGSNSSLVAPLHIGRGAYIASGSVITDNVGDDDLAFGRARQVNKTGGGKKLKRRLALKAKEK